MKQRRQDRGIGITTVPLVGGLRALTIGNCLFRKRSGHTAVQASEATGGVLLYEPRPIHEPKRTPLERLLGGASNALLGGASHRRGFPAGLDFPQGEATWNDDPESQGGVTIRGP